MKIFNKIINFVKKAIRKVAEMFKDKNPVEVVNDAAKTVAAATTAGLAIYASVNAIRVHLIPSVKKNHSSNQKSGHEMILEDRKAGSIDEKLAEMKRNTANIGKKTVTNIDKEDLEILKSIAKTRNNFFQMLPPEDQMSVLEMEEFDFKAYAKEYRKKNKRPLFHWGERLSKLGVSPEDKPFRDPVDYGFFNFILQPLDDFIHWLKNDPVPKRVPQIKLVDHPEIPNVECETAFDMISSARQLDSYLNYNKVISNEFNAFSPAEDEKQQILAEEIFRHKTLKKFNKAVKRRMMESNYNTPSLFEMMDEDEDFKKKKKKKNKKKKKHHDDLYGVSEKKNKKNKGLSKEEAKDLDAADKRARELYRYHLEKAMNGEIDRKGYRFGF